MSDPVRMIAHLDMDAFYASIELRRRPELRGQPVIVCGSSPRAVVTTASYEARRFGVHSAMPASQARRLCPQAVRIPPDFDEYRLVSRRVMAILREHVERVEVVGLDEAYLDLTGALTPKAELRRLKIAIEEATGLTCSIGLAESKLLAKLASELAKPAGLVRLPREEALERFAGESPGLIPGIGPKTVERLVKMSIRTLADLRAVEVARLQAAFGERQGAWLARRAHFDDNSPITTERHAKSQSAETTFDYDVADRGRQEEVVRELAGRLCSRLARRGLAGRNVAIKVRLDDWTTVTRARTLDEATNDAQLVGRVAVELLRAYDPPRPVRLLGVRVAAFDAVAAPAAEAADDDEEQLHMVV